MAELGTKKRPISARVQTVERAHQILAMCDERGWEAIVGIEQDKPEDISELRRLLTLPEPKRSEPKVGRNDPCPCGSGKKFKKCCMNKEQKI